MNVDIIGKHLRKDLRQLVYPRTIGQPEQTKEEFRKIKKTIRGFRLCHWVRCRRYPLLLERNLLSASALQVAAHSIMEEPGRLVFHVRIPILSDQSSHLPAFQIPTPFIRGNAQLGVSFAYIS